MPDTQPPTETQPKAEKPATTPPKEPPKEPKEAEQPPAATQPPLATDDQPPTNHTTTHHHTPGRQVRDASHHNAHSTPRRPPHPLDNVAAKSTTELQQLLAEHSATAMTGSREDMALALIASRAEQTGETIGTGILHIRRDGSGTLVPKGGIAPRNARTIVAPPRFIGYHRLRAGDLIAGAIAPFTGRMSRKSNGRLQYTINRVEMVNGKAPEESRNRKDFDGLSAVYPKKLIDLETNPKYFAARLVNLVAPIGHGQRALIVAPPKAGKTMVLKEIANSISQSSDPPYLLASLIGERPEEVTDFRRSTEAEVYASTFDEEVEEQCKMAEVVLNRARRLVEDGANVVVLMDSLTRLARAYNVASPSSGRTLSGGMDPIALYPPKKFFGAARNFEEGGSLTIIATALIETGSRLDELIYEEFKGTGNMELHLDRPMAEKRIFPAIDVGRSGTRHEELLLDEQTLRKVNMLRRWAHHIRNSSNNAENPSESIVARLRKSATNAEFLESLSKRT